ncbi:External alternative NAD(P)H-ubiquinone oxidoreductase B2, mitochondrial [Castilleja foliolosa]|uniref:External alternative NAD(P)H-ubiquinone oxidoreductase B2, mitochondrial n=1 Tax=Castilleja foliolosa TaxID=1961234 RepID=A0ABD3C564_9LAMI
MRDEHLPSRWSFQLQRSRPLLNWQKCELWPSLSRDIIQGDAVKESVEMNLEEFKSAISQVGSQMKNLPATAQVAAQQGSYLADCFNCMEECGKNPEGPLRFRGEGRHRLHPFS